jgi:hypothetical protein
LQLRVVECRLEGIPDAEPLYRVVASVLDPKQAPAEELAGLCHERWAEPPKVPRATARGMAAEGIEVALAELKTHLRGARVVLRSKTPGLVRQEVWGLLLAHLAIRGLVHEAALQADEDPDRLSFSHAVRVVRRKIPSSRLFPPQARHALHRAVLSEILEERAVSGRGRQLPRGVKRKMSNYPLRPRAPQPTTRVDHQAAIRILK